MACNRCLAWILLTSYAGLLVIGSIGVILAVSQYGYQDPLPPTPPPNLGSNTNTHLHSYNNRYGSRQDRVPEAYKEYVRASWHFAKATNDPRLYVLLPSVCSIIVSALIIVCGLWSRKFFCTTFSLYNSLALWILTLSWIIVYQSILAWDPQMDLNDSGWVVLFHVVVMLLLSGQIIIGVWELRRQRAGWPTLNFKSLFTAEFLLLSARKILTVFVLVSLANSQILRGYTTIKDPRYGFYDYPGTKFPLSLTIASSCAATYNAVATFETLLSLLFGKLHSCITATTSLLAALCCVTVAVLCSPVLVKNQIPPQYLDMTTMYFSIGLSVMTFIHVITCIGFPVASRKPPECLVNCVRTVVSSLSSLGYILASEQSWSCSVPQIRGNIRLIINMISAFFSALSMVILGAAWSSPLYRAWGTVLVLCVNFATLVRTLPPVIVESGFKQTSNIPLFERVIAMSLECLIQFIGSIAMCALCYDGAEIFGAVINLFFCFFQIYIIVQILRGKIALAQSEQHEILEETLEASNQDNQNGDNEHNPNEEHYPNEVSAYPSV